jgi:hypothetical protein
MRKNVINRNLTTELNRCALEYPVVTLTGPRQSGKTTLARANFPDFTYFNFELPDVRARFLADPRGAFSGLEEGAVFDEAQRVPELFSWLQGEVDEDPRPGRFIVTGSEHFQLGQKISQSLAGRTAVLELLPFSYGEMKKGGYDSETLDEVLWNGAYPPVHDRGYRPGTWYANYMATYLERDLRQLSAIQDLDQFQRFLMLTAGRVGQQINTSSLGDDVGVDSKTIGRWLSLLQMSYVVFKLNPYHRNARKRLVKTPKVFFLDTGLVCHLLGIQDPGQLSTHPLRGSIFENWVMAETLKMQMNRGERPTLSFWRTHDGQEVDLLRQRGQEIDLIECKSGQTVQPGFIKPMIRVSRQWREESVKRWLVYGGSESFSLLESRVCSWRDVEELNR